MRRRHLFLGLASLSALGTAASLAQVVSLPDAINKAGRQRMLSQRMGKAYLALVQSIEVQAARDVMDRSMATFDRQLVELRAFAPTRELQETYFQLDSEWSRYKLALVGAPPDKAGVAEVMTRSGKVLELAHQGTAQYEAVHAKPLGKLVNIAGRQRMLSQRMAQYYLASTLSFDVPGAQSAIAVSRKEFTAAVSLLRNAPESTARIKDELILADTQWAFLDSALERALSPVGAASSKAMRDVFLASENLLVVMDKITSMYSAIQT